MILQKISLKKIIMVIICVLYLVPLTAFCQQLEVSNIIKSTKEFLKSIHCSNDTLRGIIVIYPEKSNIVKLKYHKNEKKIEKTLHKIRIHPKFNTLEEIDVNTLSYVFQDSTTDYATSNLSIQQKQNIPNINEFCDEFILLTLPVDSVGIDTFQFNPTIPDTKYIYVYKDKLVYIKKSPKKIYDFLLPGSGRFYANKYWQGLGVALLQLAPIPLALHYNNQHQKYYDMAKDAAAYGDQGAIDKYFKKSQDYRLYSGIAVGISVASTLFNFFDVFSKRKDTELKTWVPPNGVGFTISKSL